MKKQITISEDPHNVRVHPENGQLAIRKSLRQFGAGRSLIIDAENVIVGGNGVFKEAQELGIPVRIIESDGSELIAVKRTDLHTDDEKRKALAIADNSTGDYSYFDKEKLDALVREAGEQASALMLDESIQKAIRRAEAEAGESENIETEDNPEIQFSEELLERHNYIILYFDNEVDWHQAESIFELKTVKDSHSRPGYMHSGVGRVLRSAPALNRILAVQKEGDTVNK